MFKVREEYIGGIHPILEFLAAGRPISKIWIKNTLRPSLLKEIMTAARTHHIPCSRVPEIKLNQLMHGRHQGIVGLVSPVAYEKLEHLIPSIYEQGSLPLLVVLSGLQDTRNLGAIARSALAAGAHGLLIGGESNAVITAGAMKTSAGALAHLPICRTKDLATALQDLKKSGLQIVACSEKAKDHLYQTDLTLPTALILGGEEKGILPALMAQVDKTIRIPMHGPVSSLNVSVAGALALYETVRQRSFMATS